MINLLETLQRGTHNTFADYKGQLSWGRLIGAACYGMSFLISLLGLWLFLKSGKSEILSYSQSMSVQFLIAGGALYGISKVNENTAIKNGLVTCVATPEVIKSAAAIPAIPASVQAAVVKATEIVVDKASKLDSEEKEIVPKVTLDEQS